MKSDIKFEVQISDKKINFLDTTITLENGTLKTELYNKAINTNMYLDSSSCHPPHIIKNIPKGQFIRIRRFAPTLKHTISIVELPYQIL